jgi:HAD superfamily hydrolase (TIGR01509 family)
MPDYPGADCQLQVGQMMREIADTSESLLRPPRALLFDMDGTLTEPALDFPVIKAAMGIPWTRPILEALAEMTPENRAAAQQILHEYEDRAATESKLNPGCDRLIEWITQRKFKTALVTRNSRKSVASVLARHGLSFDLLITRECANGKYKPDPTPLLMACEQLAVPPDDAWMVGDSFHDVNAGVAAGIKTVWISHGKPRDFENAPWREVRDLPGLLDLLQRAACAGV